MAHRIDFPLFINQRLLSLKVCVCECICYKHVHLCSHCDFDLSLAGGEYLCYHCGRYSVRVNACCVLLQCLKYDAYQQHAVINKIKPDTYCHVWLLWSSRKTRSDMQEA